MKISFVKRLALFTVLFLFTVSTGAQVYVTVRPAAPVIVRSLAPSPRHIWVDGEWAWRGGRYQFVNGYWVTPSRGRGLWVPGHWKQTRRGWLWKPGHWRRR